MKKIFFLLLAIPFLFASCDSDDDTTTENIGTVAGIWAYSSVSVNASTGNTLADIAIAAASSMLQSYVASGEPDVYNFDSSNNFDYYFLTEDLEISSQGSGTYVLTDNTLTLTYEDGTVVTFNVITANSTTLVLSKNSLSDLTTWAASAIGVNLTSATTTITYVISQ